MQPTKHLDNSKNDSPLVCLLVVFLCNFWLKRKLVVLQQRLGFGFQEIQVKPMLTTSVNLAEHFIPVLIVIIPVLEKQTQTFLNFHKQQQFIHQRII